MPGFTIPDGFIYPVPSDIPFQGLAHGVAGGHPLFQEQVQDKFNDVGADVGDHETRLEVLEAALTEMRWRHINSGSGGAGSNDHLITVPSGYKMLRLFTWGEITTGAEDILIRVNGDSGNNHIWGLNIRAADGTTTSFSHSGAGTSFWRIGRWSTVESCNSMVHIFPTDGNQNPSYLAYAHRDSTTSSGHQIQHGYGKYLGDVIITSLQLNANVTTFAQVDWVLEGFLA